ncbi:MAG: hypothetical protein HS111_25230 [Kofleriaceae bacterium]|nr:hypothetical protein [Kofleriaceae bacterium]
MRYLFGDSTESRLEINYLAFLRDAIDFGVAVLSADAGLSQARDRRAQRERAAEDAAREVEAFGRAALQVAEPLSHGEAPVNRAAAAVARAITDAVQRELGRVRSGQGGELEQIVAELQRLRERCVSALGALLTTHDLPGAEETVTVQWAGAGAGYEARLIQHAELGLEATLALEIPAGSLFAGELRVDRLAEGVEIHAPETAGWLKKEVKRVPHKLGRHHVTLASVAGGGVVMRLRASLEAGAAGFDVTVARDGDVAVERAGKGEADGSFPTDERDLTGLRGLAAKLEAAVDGLRATRTGLVSAILDGKPLASHEQPAVLVERLVAVMAPVVHEIAAHSLSPRELVLKRLLGGDRREEIFLSRAELVGKLEALPAAQREVFAPLGLLDDATAVGAGTGPGGAATRRCPRAGARDARRRRWPTSWRRPPGSSPAGARPCRRRWLAAAVELALPTPRSRSRRRRRCGSTPTPTRRCPSLDRDRGAGARHLGRDRGGGRGARCPRLASRRPRPIPSPSRRRSRSRPSCRRGACARRRSRPCRRSPTPRRAPRARPCRRRRRPPACRRPPPRPPSTPPSAISTTPSRPRSRADRRGAADCGGRDRSRRRRARASSRCVPGATVRAGARARRDPSASPAAAGTRADLC